MKIYFSLMLSILISPALTALPIPTPDQTIVCTIDLIPAEEFFFNTAAHAFLKDTGHRAGQAEVSLENVHTIYQPLKIKVANNSQKALVIPKDTYITTVTQATMTIAAIAKLYPDFKSTGTALNQYSILTLIGTLLSCGGVLAGSGIEVKLMSGFMAMVMGPLTIALRKKANHALKLAKKHHTLVSTGPKLIIPGKNAVDLQHEIAYHIPPNATFEDVLLAHMPWTITSTPSPRLNGYLA